MRDMNGWHGSLKHWGGEACEFADRVLAAGPDNSTCVASAAFAYAGIARRHNEAIELAERAIALHPNSVFVRNRAGTAYGNGGEFEKSLAQYEAALRLNPRHPRSSTFTLTGISAAHFHARRFDQSVEWGDAPSQLHQAPTSPARRLQRPSRIWVASMRRGPKLCSFSGISRAPPWSA